MIQRFLGHGVGSLGQYKLTPKQRADRDATIRKFKALCDEFKKTPQEELSEFHGVLRDLETVKSRLRRYGCKPNVYPDCRTDCPDEIPWYVIKHFGPEWYGITTIPTPAPRPYGPRPMPLGPSVPTGEGWVPRPLRPPYPKGYAPGSFAWVPGVGWEAVGHGQYEPLLQHELPRRPTPTPTVPGYFDPLRGGWVQGEPPEGWVQGQPPRPTEPQFPEWTPWTPSGERRPLPPEWGGYRQVDVPAAAPTPGRPLPQMPTPGWGGGVPAATIPPGGLPAFPQSPLTGAVFQMQGPIQPQGFARSGLGRPQSLSGPQLGQGIDEIRAEIDKLPAKDAETYLKRLEGCLQQLAVGGLTNLVLAYKCIDDLYKDVRAAVKALEEPEPPKPTPVTFTPPPPPSGPSPALLPVLGLLAVAGVGAYFAFK